MPPVKKYTTSFPPAPCKIEAKTALETAADVVTEKIGRTVKPAALARQVLVSWLTSQGFYKDEPEETADLQEFEFILKKL